MPLVAAAVIAADQVTKTLAVDHLQPGVARHVIGPANWLLTFNSGAAFSMGTGVTPIVEAGVVILVGGLILVTRRARATASAPVLVGLGLVVGGALSNLGDRFFRGYHGAVVDFIQAVSWWPVFNVADSCVVVGVIVLVLGWRSRVPAS